MRIKIYCPVCKMAGINRWLMEVDSKATGTIYPYCKGCRKNVEIKLNEIVPSAGPKKGL